ncbi:MAG: DUF937 domain-containing protein [Chloroflexota bacterium]
MTSSTDLLEQLLQPSSLDRISNQVGANPDQTRTAIQEGLPMLLAGLERNAADPQGAQSLQRALSEDRHADLLDDVQGYLTGARDGKAANGSGILDHILGDRQEPAAQALGQRAGLSGGSILQILATLAPLVMGMLGKKSGSGSSGGGFPDLGQILGQERQTAQAGTPDIGSILDQAFGGKR